MKSFSTVTRRAHWGLRMAVPYCLIVMLFFSSLISTTYPFEIITKTPFFLMAVYYWSIYRPRLVPPVLMFVAGGLMDLLSAAPLGMNALIFVSVQWFVSEQRRFLMGQSFIMIWIGFALINIAVMLMQWLIFSFVAAEWFSVEPLVVPILLGVVLFPITYTLLYFTHRILPSSV